MGADALCIHHRYIRGSHRILSAGPCQYRQPGTEDHSSLTDEAHRPDGEGNGRRWHTKSLDHYRQLLELA